jgi:hypothetical protein
MLLFRYIKRGAPQTILRAYLRFADTGKSTGSHLKSIVTLLYVLLHYSNSTTVLTLPMVLGSLTDTVHASLTLLLSVL